MKYFKRKITGAFAFAAALGLGTAPAHAQEVPDSSYSTTENAGTVANQNQPPTTTEIAQDNDLVAHYPRRISYDTMPPPPRRLDDYERNLTLPECQIPDDPIYRKMEDVVRYMQYPNQTPDITSPNMTETQIIQAQRFLQTLGFNIEDDGVEGPATTRAVMEFQMFWGPISNTMDINGIIDNNVIDHMEYYTAVAERDARTYGVETEVAAAIRMATLLKQDSFELWMEMSLRESSHRPDARPPRGTARGLFQHIERTYDKDIMIAGCNYGMGQYAQKFSITYNGIDDAEIVYSGSEREHRFLYNTRYNPRFSAVMAVENNLFEVGLVEHWLGQSLQENYQRYSIHFKGVDAGYFFWRGYFNNPNATAARDFPAQARYNRRIYYNGRQARTYSQVADWFDAHFGTGRYTEQYQVAVYQPRYNTSNIRYAGQVEQPAAETTVTTSAPEQPAEPNYRQNNLNSPGV